MKLSDLPAGTLDKVTHLADALGDGELPDPAGWHLLVLQYVRPTEVVTPSGFKLLMPDQTKKEDIYQGRVGVVLAKGPEAYADKAKYPKGGWCQVGDWIMWPPVEAAVSRFAYGKGATLVLIADDRVIATGVDPLRSVMSG